MLTLSVMVMPFSAANANPLTRITMVSVLITTLIFACQSLVTRPYMNGPYNVSMITITAMNTPLVEFPCRIHQEIPACRRPSMRPPMSFSVVPDAVSVSTNAVIHIPFFTLGLSPSNVAWPSNDRRQNTVVSIGTTSNLLVETSFTHIVVTKSAYAVVWRAFASLLKIIVTFSARPPPYNFFLLNWLFSSNIILIIS